MIQYVNCFQFYLQTSHCPVLCIWCPKKSGNIDHIKKVKLQLQGLTERFSSHLKIYNYISWTTLTRFTITHPWAIMLICQIQAEVQVIWQNRTFSLVKLPYSHSRYSLYGGGKMTDLWKGVSQQVTVWGQAHLAILTSDHSEAEPPPWTRLSVPGEPNITWDYYRTISANRQI